MDERLEKALNFSNYMTTLNNQRRMLKEQFKESTIYYHNGCQFTVTYELISFCNMLLSREQDSVVLIDDNSIPVNVELEDFTEQLQALYYSASNDYLTAYNKLKSNRSVEGIIDA